MKISTTSRYGVRAVVDIAMYQSKGPVSIHSISKRQDISIKYLELIFLPLKKAGLLTSTRGVKGGYRLTKDPSLITPGDIVRIVDGHFDFVECLNTDNNIPCKRMSKCVTQSLWLKLKLAVEEVLDSITIQELANQQLNLNKSAKSVSF
jgi:Rrf2 family transcriptional regulator, cysteine metabolism repressor